MNLGIRGHTVDSITFDYRVTLAFGDGTVINIESPFEVTLADGSVTLITPEKVSEPLVVLTALHDEVLMADYDEAGILRIDMKLSSWVVRPGALYESWTLGGPGTPSRIVAGPAGSLLVWS